MKGGEDRIYGMPMSSLSSAAVSSTAVSPSAAASSAAGTDTSAPPRRSAKPFVKWAGGKAKLLSELVAHLPQDYGTYHEPFAGGAALFFEIAPEKATLSDVNPELMNTYRVIQSDVESLIEELRQHRHNEEYFYEIRNADRSPDFASWGDAKRAGRFLYLNKTCFNGLYRVNSQGQFNVPFGDYSNPRLVDEENLRACAAALAGTKLSEDSFTNLTARVRSGDLVYLDPPYAPLTATANFTSYSKEGFGVELQTALRDVCVDLDSGGVKFMLSNSYTPLVLDLYKKFNIDCVLSPRAINSKASRRGPVPEVIVTNY